MDVVLQIKNMQLEMMQMLNEVEEDILRIRENNKTHGDEQWSGVDDNDIMVSSITQNKINGHLTTLD